MKSFLLFHCFCKYFDFVFVEVIYKYENNFRFNKNLLLSTGIGYYSIIFEHIAFTLPVYNNCGKKSNVLEKMLNSSAQLYVRKVKKK